MKKIFVEEINRDTDFEMGSTTDSTSAKETPINFFSNVKYLATGIFFGIVLVKGEVVSWFRIQEMFHLQSFYMYGVIGSAVIVGIVSVWIIKRFKLKTIKNTPVTFTSKKFYKGQILGGLCFGLGWAMTGACPGPIFAQIGAGFFVVIVVLMSAVAGTWVYGLFRNQLPH